MEKLGPLISETGIEAPVSRIAVLEIGHDQTRHGHASVDDDPAESVFPIPGAASADVLRPLCFRHSKSVFP